MNRAYALLLPILTIASVAMGEAEHKSAGAGAKAPAGWNAAALRTADGLAAKLRAAGIPCDGYEASPFAMFGEGYQSRLQLPAAAASCTTDGTEDLTFEVFADAAHARSFIKTKHEYLCNHAVQGFPGFPYLDGGTWIIEPDEQATATKLARILGGKAAMAACPIK